LTTEVAKREGGKEKRSEDEKVGLVMSGPSVIEERFT
jgi:hypothetical protein